MLFRSELQNSWGFEAITFISMDDLHKVTPSAPRFYLPLCFPLSDVPYKDKPSNVFNVLWLGSFGWGPNEEGMHWFAKEVYPVIKTLLDQYNIVFNIIGSNPTQLIQSLHDGKHVFVHGFVDDISSFLNDSHLLIAPLLHGGGVRVKVLQAMSMGIPVLGTSKGCEGIGLTHKRNTWLADNPRDFASAILRLASDRDLCDDISNAGRRFLLRNYNIEKSLNLKRSIYDALLSRPRVRRVAKKLLPPLVRRHLKKFIGKVPVLRRIVRKFNRLDLGIRSPYDGLTYLKPISCTALDKSYESLTKCIDFSVVIPVKNESESIEHFLESLGKQTLQAKEILFVDDSTDETGSIIERFSSECNLPVRLLHSKNSPQSLSGRKSTLAGDRNYAVVESTTDIIVFTDAGTRLEEDFFSNIVGPFCEDEELEFVGGIYDAQSPDLTATLVYDWETIDWNVFLPSCRSLAIKKSLFYRAQGLPEFLSFAGEDSYFDIACRRVSSRWVFNKKALVHWTAPETQRDRWKKYYTYGVGDGENGAGDFHYYKQFIHLQRFGRVSIDAMCDDTVFAAFNGYLAGRLRRGLLDKYRNMSELVVLCVERPLFCSPSSLALLKQLTDNNHRVICVIAENGMPCPEKATYIDADISKFELYFVNDFRMDDILSRYGFSELFFKMKFVTDPDNVSPRVFEFLRSISLFSLEEGNV